MSLFNFTKKPVIVTHNGTFHADDVFATAVLLLHLKKNTKEVEIVRSREFKDWDRADYLVDVGGVYDEAKKRFDHHQEGGAGKRKNGISYAAFGLVWKAYGIGICGGNEILTKRIDETLVTPFDAHDTGTTISNSLYVGVAPFGVSHFVMMMNPTWREDPKEDYSRFLELVGIAKKIIERAIVFYRDEEEAKVKVIEDYKRSSDKRIMVLSADYPWHSTIPNFPEPLFVVHPRKDGTWGIKAVRDSLTEFKNRKDLPKEWAGKYEKELQEITGVPDALLVHNGRFMAVAKTKEGALQLAKIAVNS